MNNGAIDTTFGSSGYVTLTPGISDYLEDVVVQPDGKIVAVGAANIGGNSKFAVVRYNSDGSLDTANFGTGGYVTLTPGTSDYLSGVALQPDGKIVAVGTGDSQGVVVRYNSDGSLDENNFGTGGYASLTIGTSGYLFDVVLQPDGKIIAVGQAVIGSNGNWVLARYNSDGSLDENNFGTGGFVTLAPGTNGNLISVVLQPDGKIIAGGTDTSGLPVFCVARYNSDGSLDEDNFGTGGFASIAPGTNNYFYNLALQSDGKIVAVGMVQIGTYKHAVIRLNTNGSLDEANFGTGGIVTLTPESYDALYDVVVQPDGKIVAAGFASATGVFKFCVARYETGGSLDTSFGTSGYVKLTPGTMNFLNGMALQPDGKIVGVGKATISSAQKFAVVRLNLALADVVFPTEGRGSLQELAAVSQGTPNDILTEPNSNVGALVEELPRQNVVVSTAKRTQR